VNQLLIKTLGWDESDIITFKDVSSKMTNLYNKINMQIERLKTAASVNTNENAQHLNVLAFIGHGGINE
jgi:glycine cleavage system regulatory protein